MATSVNRKTYRQILATEIGAALNTANLVQATYGYPIGDFAAQSPVVTVISAGSDRRAEITGGTDAETVLAFAVDVFVLYADKATGWTEAHCEDRLDDIEQVVANWVQANDNGLSRIEAGQPGWFALAFERQSATGSYQQPERIGGLEYRRERMTIMVVIRAGAS